MFLHDRESGGHYRGDTSDDGRADLESASSSASHFGNDKALYRAEAEEGTEVQKTVSGQNMAHDNRTSGSQIWDVFCRG